MTTIKEKILEDSRIRYLTSGLIAFIVDYGLLLFTYYVLRLPLPLSTSIGFVSGLVLSFQINRKWVYGKSGRDRHPIRQLIEYSLLVALNYIFTVLSINWLNDKGVSPVVSKIIIMALIVIWNYLIFSKLIFTSKEKSIS